MAEVPQTAHDFQPEGASEATEQLAMAETTEVPFESKEEMENHYEEQAEEQSEQTEQRVEEARENLLPTLEQGIVTREGDEYMVTAEIGGGDREHRYAFQEYIDSEAPAYRYSRITLVGGETIDAVNTRGGHFYNLEGDRVDLNGMAQLVPITDENLINQLEAVRQGRALERAGGGSGEAPEEAPGEDQMEESQEETAPVENRESIETNNATVFQCLDMNDNALTNEITVPMGSEEFVELDYQNEVARNYIRQAIHRRLPWPDTIPVSIYGANIEALVDAMTDFCMEYGTLSVNGEGEVKFELETSELDGSLLEAHRIQMGFYEYVEWMRVNPDTNELESNPDQVESTLRNMEYHMKNLFDENLVTRYTYRPEFDPSRQVAQNQPTENDQG